MDNQNFNNELQDLIQVVEQLESISKEVDSENDRIDKDAILQSPISSIGKIVDAGNYVIKKYNEVVSKGGILGEGKQVVINELKKVKDVFKVKENSNKPNPPKPPGVPRNYDTSDGERATNIQAAGAKPIEVNFRTDITNRTYGDIDLTHDKVIYKTPIILCRQILDFSQLYDQAFNTDGSLTHNENAVMALYVNSVLNKLNNIAQMRVNFSTSFNYTEIKTFLSTVCNALHAYYGIYSIIQFEQDFHNKNEGMESIRASISAQDWNLIDIFTNDLKSTPIPPKLAELFYMLNANYRYEDMPKVPIIKFTGADIDNTGVLNFNISDQIKDLNETTFRDICRKIMRTIPNWYGNELPMYGPETYHSRNFNTIYANSGTVIKCHNEEWAYAPTFNSNIDSNYLTSDHIYFSNTNELDGLTTSLFALRNYANAPTTTQEDKYWVTGLFRPKAFSKFSNNRAVYYEDELRNMDNDWNNGFPFTYNIDPSTNMGTSSQIGVSQEQIYGLSINSLREMSKELVDWMFDLESIPGRESNVSKSKGKSRFRSRKRKSKTKEIEVTKG